MFSLSSVVPWGRSFDEYVRMFALTEGDLTSRILGCGDGPASFNAEATRRGTRVVSCDPLYQFDAAQIRQRIDETATEVLAQARQNAHEFVWDTAIPSVEALGRVRMTAMATFLDDYERGRAGGRYVDAGLPVLPFADDAFDLAVCSHFLFLYSQQFDAAFHLQSMRELCRVAREVRVFPLLALGAQSSPHVGAVREALAEDGFVATVERVPYEFQRGGHEMLRVRTPQFGMSTHRVVHAPGLPTPMGPYSAATVFERLVFVAGQGARVPATDVLSGPDIESQTEQCLRNVEAILVAAGSSLQHVLRCGVFLVDMGEFERMNRVYARLFGDHKPARTTVQVAALPAEGLRVEIDCIAYIP